ncbi:hypothetical protein GOODEAATRI_019606 [Goodea atripinnis]|uniref:Uncharacterized protein n=1 Tax=Goodea atripinnis TaxID=208336 RepID=A0ABV0PZT4_9TELE
MLYCPSLLPADGSGRAAGKRQGRSGMWRSFQSNCEGEHHRNQVKENFIHLRVFTLKHWRLLQEPPRFILLRPKLNPHGNLQLHSQQCSEFYWRYIPLS